VGLPGFRVKRITLGDNINCGTSNDSDFFRGNLGALLRKFLGERDSNLGTQLGIVFDELHV